MTESNVQIVLKYNDCIANRDIDGLASCMTDGHSFIDSANREFRGKEKTLESWRGFFSAFPEYKNVFDQVIEKDSNTFVMVGHSICPNNQELEGSAIWKAKVQENQVSEWQVYEDTPDNRKHLGIH